MKKFSKSWKSSKQPRKQRKYRANAPKHIKSKFMVARVHEDLQEEHGIKRIRVREGDTVQIERGDFKGKRGEVTDVILRNQKLHITGAERVTSDGSTTPYPIDPSNVTITELDTEDTTRL